MNKLINRRTEGSGFFKNLAKGSDYDNRANSSQMFRFFKSLVNMADL